MVAGGKTIRVLSLGRQAPTPLRNLGHILMKTPDGGGARGLSSIVILSHLLHLAAQQLEPPHDGGTHDELLPSELFDHIVGTSTGG